MKPGSVHLIGAGPGDPALITVRGQRLLRSADVVVHDHEVHHRLLESVRPEAERIDAAALATRSGDPRAVGLLLAEKAAAGLTVARLTAGDPLDAAAGEAAALRAADVAFTVVPGIPRLPNELTCAGPLSGKRILVTRPREQAADLLDRLLDGAIGLLLRRACGRALRVRGARLRVRFGGGVRLGGVRLGRGVRLRRGARLGPRRTSRRRWWGGRCGTTRRTAPTR